MATILEIATTNYEDDIFKIKKALSHLQTTCEITDGYLLSKPVSKFGWTFCQLLLKPAFNYNIEKIFSDMIQKYRGKNDEKFTKFMQDFFQARDCTIKLKLVEY
ncbi:MAG TPA: hypothetical protein VLC72_01950 [Nitrosopumilaceae archaeon]|nr:hypothetical protein [Nitrosopumilaceae archaeon]